MKRSNRKRHRPEEVAAKLRQADEAPAKGTPIAEVAMSLGVSEVTLHRWRAEYGTMDPGGWPAPEHAAPHGAAEPVPAQTGRHDKGGPMRATPSPTVVRPKCEFQCLHQGTLGIHGANVGRLKLQHGNRRTSNGYAGD